MTSAKAEGLIFVAAAIWGLSFVFTAWGVGVCPPALFVLLRFLGAFAVTLAVFGRYIPTIDKATFRQGMALGSLFCGGFLLQTYSVAFGGVTRAAFIAAMTLPATPFVTWLVLRRPVAKWSILGVAVALAGLFILLNPLAPMTVDDQAWRFLGLYLGDWIAIASVPVWAFYLNYMDVFTRGREGPGATGKMLLLQFTAAIPILAVVWLVSESGLFFAPPAGLDTPVAWGRELAQCLLYNAVFASFLLTFLQTYAQRYTTPVKAMIMFQFEPIVATVAAILLLGDELTWRSVAGPAIIIAGVLASELGEGVWARLTGPAEPNPGDGAAAA